MATQNTKKENKEIVKKQQEKPTQQKTEVVKKEQAKKETIKKEQPKKVEQKKTAPQKKEQPKKQTSSSTSKHSSSNVFTWGINKISMYTIIAVALLYVISLILSLVNVNLKVITGLQGFATAIMICIVSTLAWRYVKNKEMVWKILYIICLLLVLLGIVIPLIAL